MVERKQSRTPQGRFCTKRRDVRHMEASERASQPSCRRSLQYSSQRYNLDQAFSKATKTARNAATDKASHIAVFLCKKDRIACIGVVPRRVRSGPGSARIGFMAGASGGKLRMPFSPVASRRTFHVKRSYVFACSPRITPVITTILYKDSLKSLH